MSMVQTAIAIAARAHGGQTRRDGVTPYIAHAADVAHRLRDNTDEVIATAWLHDTIEDSNGEVTAGTLRSAGLPEEVVQAVSALTHQPGESYDVYLSRVKECAIAKQVKIQDILSNLSDGPIDRQIIKYAKALLYLLSA